jgi:4-hydroxy-2-oxoglutarate aldolase
MQQPANILVQRNYAYFQEENLRSTQLAGVMPPVPTPFDEQGEIALDKLQDNLEQLARHSLSGFVMLGSNGEYVYLDEEEKVAIFKAARQAIPADKLFIAGTGAEATRTALRLTKIAADAGADVAIIITPAYYKPAMTKDAMIGHFTALADASPIPIILYNMPAYAGIDLSTDTVLHLAEHPNIIGLKESSGNLVKISEITRGIAEKELDFAVLAGSASFLQPAVMMGASGGVLAAANVAPDLCIAIYNACQQGKTEESRRLQHSILPLNSAVTTRYGVAGLKFIMDRCGLYGGPVRSPLLPLTGKDKAMLMEMPLLDKIKG